MKHDGSEHKGPLYYKSNISEWVVGQCGVFLGGFFGNYFVEVQKNKQISCELGVYN